MMRASENPRECFYLCEDVSVSGRRDHYLLAAARVRRTRRWETTKGWQMSRQSVAKAHEKIQELSWEPRYHEPVSQYGTEYKFHKAQKKA